MTDHWQQAVAAASAHLPGCGTCTQHGKAWARCPHYAHTALIAAAPHPEVMG